MPIPLPKLYDRTYAELTGEAQALLPTINPTWTNHNPSDPGIVLMEMLAWLTEILLFRVDEIPDANTVAFLKLLNGPDWRLPAQTSLDDAVRQTVVDLRTRYRAVTPTDYEQLTLAQWPQSAAAQALGPASRIRRVRCVPQRHLDAPDPAVRQQPATGHVSLVVVPEPAEHDTAETDTGRGSSGTSTVESKDFPHPTEALRHALWEFFDPRRILTTHHHIVGPEYLPVAVGANLALREDAPPQLALTAARSALLNFCHPLTGGADGTGWPFGRALYVSEIYAILDQVPLVDYVEDVRISILDNSYPEGTERLLHENNQLAGILLDEHELLQLQVTGLIAYDVYGQQHEEISNA